MDAEGSAPPEGEGNATEGGCFASLYTNTVLGSFVRPSVCSSTIETTFPLSNFKTKHIFGILMALRKFLKPFGAL